MSALDELARKRPCAKCMHPDCDALRVERARWERERVEQEAADCAEIAALGLRRSGLYDPEAHQHITASGASLWVVEIDEAARG